MGRLASLQFRVSHDPLGSLGSCSTICTRHRHLCGAKFEDNSAGNSPAHFDVLDYARREQRRCRLVVEHGLRQCDLLFQRAAAALRATSERCSGVVLASLAAAAFRPSSTCSACVSCAARVWPPFFPPILLNLKCSSGVNWAIRALPPRGPPILPSAEAYSFFLLIWPTIERFSSIRQQTDCAGAPASARCGPFIESLAHPRAAWPDSHATPFECWLS